MRLGQCPIPAASAAARSLCAPYRPVRHVCAPKASAAVPARTANSVGGRHWVWVMCLCRSRPSNSRQITHTADPQAGGPAALSSRSHLRTRCYTWIVGAINARFCTRARLVMVTGLRRVHACSAATTYQFSCVQTVCSDGNPEAGTGGPTIAPRERGQYEQHRVVYLGSDRVGGRRADRLGCCGALQCPAVRPRARGSTLGRALRGSRRPPGWLGMGRGVWRWPGKLPRCGRLRAARRHGHPVRPLAPGSQRSSCRSNISHPPDGCPTSMITFASA
jgi:hypothetical protein